MPWRTISGLWKNQKGNLSLKMTQDLLDKLSRVPNGSYLVILANNKKTEDRHPDYNMGYFQEEETQPTQELPF